MSVRSHITPARAAFMLVLVTLFWGMSFSLTFRWQEATRGQSDSLLTGLTLIGLRMFLALAILAIWQRRVVFGASPQEFWSGALIGARFFGRIRAANLGTRLYNAGAIGVFYQCVQCLGAADVPVRLRSGAAFADAVRVGPGTWSIALSWSMAGA